MKRVATRFAPLAVLMLLLMSVMVAAANPQKSPPREDSMTIWQARRTLIAGAKYLYVAAKDWSTGKKGWGTGKIDPRSFRFTPDSFEFDAFDSKKGTRHFQVDLKTFEAVRVINDALTNAAGKPLPGGLYWEDHPFKFWSLSNPSTCSADCVYAGESFAAALNRLRWYAGYTWAPLRTFTQQAAAWRALPAKPPIPEKVRAQRLLAENALQEKQLAEALNHYETGLEIYPTWPQGWFNASMIAAELGLYADAVEHMQAYLELVPEAADAPAARDQILIWRSKAEQQARNELQ